MKEKQKMQLVPGEKYHGTFWVNEFGEFQCQPEQKGTNPNGTKMVTEGENWSIKTSKNRVQVLISLPKGGKDVISEMFTKAVTVVITKLLTYNFKK